MPVGMLPAPSRRLLVRWLPKGKKGGSLMRAVLLGLLVAALGAGNADAQKNESANFMVPVCKKWLAGSGAKDAEGLQLIFDAGVCSGTISTLTHVRELVLP